MLPPCGHTVSCSHVKAQSQLIIRASALSSAVYILLGAGGLMMIVGFFGCFGAVRESQCLLASVKRNVNVVFFFYTVNSYLLYLLFVSQFFACLLIIFGAEIVAGVFGFMNKEQVPYSNNNDWV